MRDPWFGDENRSAEEWESVGMGATRIFLLILITDTVKFITYLTDTNFVNPDSDHQMVKTMISRVRRLTLEEHAAH